LPVFSEGKTDACREGMVTDIRDLHSPVFYQTCARCSAGTNILSPYIGALLMVNGLHLSLLYFLLFFSLVVSSLLFIFAQDYKHN
jgi:hypothetical protein